jgi:regulation of enolase protein 1 (concanavalin A-like superfamily)
VFEQCVWLNEPKSWQVTAGSLRMTTDRKTDFWRETHYGFVRDSGHLFGAEVTGEFTAQLRVRAGYSEQYDQAGIMVRVDQERWVKAGIELCDGRLCLGSVLTVARSDWATGPFDGDAGDFRIRATLSKGVLRLQASADGRVWPILRLCPFPIANTYIIGAMACTPERSGLEVEFSDFAINPPSNKDLHDLS